MTRVMLALAALAVVAAGCESGEDRTVYYDNDRERLQDRERSQVAQGTAGGDRSTDRTRTEVVVRTDGDDDQNPGQTAAAAQRADQRRADQRRAAEERRSDERRSDERRSAQATAPSARDAEGKRDGDRTRFTMAYPTGDRQSSVLLVEKLVPNQVRLNQPFTYEIKVTNIADSTLDDVRIREETPEGLSITASQPERQGREGQAQPAGEKRPAGQDQAQPAAQGQQPGQAQGGASAAESTWELGNLKPKESRTIQVSAVAQRQGQLGTCVMASYQPSLCAAINVVNPQLQVTKKAPERADICEELVWEYSVTNSGSGSTEPVVVREQLPEGLTTASGNKVVEMDAGTIREGQTKTGRVKLKAAKPGEYRGRAVASSAGGLQAESAETTTMITQPRLAVNIEGPEQEYVDRPITYRVTVTNEGDAPAREAAVSVQVPNASKLVNVGTEGRTERNAIGWNLGTLEPKATKSITFTLAGTEAAALETVARAKAVCAEDVSDAAQTKILTIPALVLEVVDLADPVRVGDNVTYRINVTNQGSGADNRIAVTAELPEQLEFVSAKGSSEARAEGRVVRFNPVATLAPGRSASWELTAKANAAADARFEVQLESESLTKPAYENEPTRLY